MAETLEIRFVEPEGQASLQPRGATAQADAPRVSTPAISPQAGREGDRAANISRDFTVSMREAAERIRTAIEEGFAARASDAVTPPPVVRQQPLPRREGQGEREQSEESTEQNRLIDALRENVGRSRFGRIFSRTSDTVGNALARRQASSQTARGATSAASGRAAAGVPSTATRAAGGTVARTGGALAGTAAPLAIAAGAAAVGLVALAAATKLVIDGFGRIGDELEDVSGPIAAVRAEEQRRLELARVRRAEILGERVARVEQARADLAVAIYELQTSIMDAFADLAPVIEAILDAVTAGLAFMELIKEVLDVLAEAATGDIPGAIKEFQDLPAAMQKFQNRFAQIFTANQPPGTNLDPDVLRALGFTARVRPNPARPTVANPPIAP